MDKFKEDKRMSKYVYSSCLGDIYLSNESGLDYEVCGQCGDTDTYLGLVSSSDELRKLLSNERYNSEYIEEVVQNAIKYRHIKE